MRKLIACAMLAFALAGCSTLPTLNVGGAVTKNTLLGIESAYGIALSAENSYKALPLCKTGTTFSPTNICARRSIIVRLQAADLKVRQSIETANAFQKTYPTISPANYIAAAQAALSSLQGVLATTGVQ